MAEWFVQHAGLFKSVVDGPFTIEQLRSLYNSGRLPGFKLVRRVDESSWLTLSNTPLWDQLRNEARSSASWGALGDWQENRETATAAPSAQPQASASSSPTDEAILAEIKALRKDGDRRELWNDIPFIIGGLFLTWLLWPIISSIFWRWMDRLF